VNRKSYGNEGFSEGRRDAISKRGGIIRRRYGTYMLSADRSSHVIVFDVFQVDLRAGELYKTGRKIKLQGQPFEALAMLLERPGEVVTREEFRKRLWPEDTFVDFEHSLNTAIKKLRQALGEDKSKPRFVETLPKRGYRFIGEVEQREKQRARRESAPRTSWVGCVAKLSAMGDDSVALVATDEEAAAERDKLDAAKDDVGLSLLIASQKLLLLPAGTPVRILEVQETASRCQVRILEGEHYGKAALVPLKSLVGLP